MITRRSFSALAASAAATPWATAQTVSNLPAWPELLAKARGQTVYFNAWAGDEKTNAFIAWVGEQTLARYGVAVQHVRLKDTAEAVTRVVAEKAAGRNTDGAVDLVWINGPNFLNMQRQGLLYGPVTQALPNFRYVDTVNKRSNVIDFTTPVQGMACPGAWRKLCLCTTQPASRTRRTYPAQPQHCWPGLATTRAA